MLWLLRGLERSAQASLYACRLTPALEALQRPLGAHGNKVLNVASFTAAQFLGFLIYVPRKSSFTEK